MASIAGMRLAPAVGDERFFAQAAMVMTAVIVAGFSLQLAAGRSSFSSPLLVHAHAVVFMGWVFIYLLQNIFAAGDRMALHRRLGWIAAGWMVPMLVLGCMVTVAIVRRGQVPFFFRPLHFLIFDPVTLIAFMGLRTAAILLRRRTQWHRRLHFCGMAMLLGPAIGRLLPMPLLQPWAWESTIAVSLIFPVAGMLADVRRGGQVHPAWRWGIGAMIAALLVTEAMTYSPVGQAIYAGVTKDSPGASVAPLQFAPPPISGKITGRT